MIIQITTQYQPRKTDIMEMQCGRLRAVQTAHTRTAGTAITLTFLALTGRSSSVVAVTTLVPVLVCSVSAATMAMPASLVLSVLSCPYFNVTSEEIEFVTQFWEENSIIILTNVIQCNTIIKEGSWYYDYFSKIKW